MILASLLQPKSWQYGSIHSVLSGRDKVANAPGPVSALALGLICSIADEVRPGKRHVFVGLVPFAVEKEKEVTHDNDLDS